jgi:hypothetical protein
VGLAPDVGGKAPELTGTGEAGRLADHAGAPLVVYFASSATRDSKLALGALEEDLAKAGEIPGTCFLIVLSSEDEVTALADEIAGLPIETHTVVSSDRADMATYGVIAYPTAFVLDSHHDVVAIVRGYGTLSGFRTVAALRLAGGLIPREEYLRLTGGGLSATVPKPDRYVRMAEKLIGEGRTSLALDTLASSLDASSSLRHIVLTARLAVALDDSSRFEGALARLTSVPEAARELGLLRIERDIRTGNLDGARRELDASTATHSPRTQFLRGLLAEAHGDEAASAASFREAAAAFAVLESTP